MIMVGCASYHYHTIGPKYLVLLLQQINVDMCPLRSPTEMSKHINTKNANFQYANNGCFYGYGQCIDNEKYVLEL